MRRMCWFWLLSDGCSSSWVLPVMTVLQKRHHQSELSDCIPNADPNIVVFLWRRLIPTHSVHCWICQPASRLMVCRWGRWLAESTFWCSNRQCSRWDRAGDEWYYTMLSLQRGRKTTDNRLWICIPAKQNNAISNIVKHFSPVADLYRKNLDASPHSAKFSSLSCSIQGNLAK